MKTTLVMICVPRSVLPHDAKSGFPLFRATLHGAHIWAALFIASAASSNSASVVYRPKPIRSEEHTSELQSLMRISYAVFCLKKKKIKHDYNTHLNLSV